MNVEWFALPQPRDPTVRDCAALVAALVSAEHVGDRPAIEALIEGASRAELEQALKMAAGFLHTQLERTGTTERWLAAVARASWRDDGP